jgi:hypothetical protein
MNKFNHNVLCALRKHITIVSEPLHSRIQSIIENMSVEERKMVFYGWGAPAHSNWLFDDDLLGIVSTKQLIKFTSTVNRLTAHPKYKSIFAVYFDKTMAALIPCETEQQVAEELNKKIMLL